MIISQVMNLRLLGAVFAFLLVLPLNLISQTLPFRTYTVKDGLAANDVEAISQDSEGRLWVGTTNGISVFDGKTFTNYSVRDGLPFNFVHEFIPDRYVPGKMWMLSGNNVCSFVGGRFKTYNLNGNFARTIYQDQEGIVWCGTDRGVQLIENDSVTNIELPFPPQSILAITCTGDSLMWFALDSVIVSYSPKTRNTRRVNIHSTKTRYLTNMFADKHGNVWITLTYRTILRIDREYRIQEKEIFPPGATLFVMDSQNNVAWIGASTGIGKLNLSQFPNISVGIYSTEMGSSDDIKSGFIDREGNLWIGLHTKGLSRLISDNIFVFSLGKLWFGAYRQTGASDSNGHIWIMSDGDLIEFWRDSVKNWHSYRHEFCTGSPFAPNGEYGVNNPVVAFSFDKAGRLWVARVMKNNPLTCYEVEQDTSTPDPSISGRSRLKEIFSIPFDFPIRSFVIDTNKRLWASLWTDELLLIDLQNSNRIIRKFGEKDGYPFNFVHEIFLDSRGNIWGTTLRRGVVKLAESNIENGRFKQFSIQDGLPGMHTLPMIEDRSGNILVGVMNAGLALIKDDSVRVLTMKDGLPSNNIGCMTIDASGRLWLGTTIGMVHESTPNSFNFIENQTFLETQAQVCGTTKDGLLWWVTLNQLSVYDYLAEPTLSLPPPIQITRIKVNGETREPEKHLEFTYNNNNVEISFIGISLKNPEAVRYQYRLQGSDDRWNLSTMNNSITYGNLSPGEYTFEVKAKNVDGIESTSSAVVRFVILPPYWNQWWFYMFVSIAILSLMLIGYRQRVHRFKHEQMLSQDFSRQLIASQEDERKRIARDLHDNLGQELIIIANRARKGLKITADTQAKDQFDLISKTASNALNGVRDIAYNLSPYHLDQVGLTGSIKGMIENITIASDIQFQLTLEDAQTGLPKEAEIHVYRIIQECVNNIIKHSLATQATISMKQKTESLAIIVSDNGKGLSSESKIQNSETPGGFGLKSLTERVKLLGGTLSIDSSDGIGTTIEISVPMGNKSSENSSGHPHKGNAA